MIPNFLEENLIENQTYDLLDLNSHNVSNIQSSNEEQNTLNKLFKNDKYSNTFKKGIYIAMIICYYTSYIFIDIYYGFINTGYDRNLQQKLYFIFNGILLSIFSLISIIVILISDNLNFSMIFLGISIYIIMALFRISWIILIFFYF